MAPDGKTFFFISVNFWLHKAPESAETHVRCFNFIFAYLIPKTTSSYVSWDDFRPTPIVCVIQKLYLKCLLLLLEPYVRINTYIQYGCAKGHQALEVIHILRTILQFANLWCVPVVIFSLDIWKAFDTLDLGAVQELLEVSTVPLRLKFAILKEILHERWIYLKGPGFHTGYIRQARGLRQGSPENAFLFSAIICMTLEQLQLKWQREGKGYTMSYSNGLSFN